MLINYGGYQEFLMKQKNKKIICFGAGMMPYYVELLISQWGILDNILCYLDNDIMKDNTFIGRQRKIPVWSIDTFLKKQVQDIILLITCETFAPVCRQLDKIEQLRDVECYLYPYINKSYFDACTTEGLIISSNVEKIPRNIHYCWFGKKEMSALEKRCIQSWKKNCPEYEIVRWDESNYDFRENIYMKQAYDEKKWAFVSDYARLDILYEYGGIYFDTDVEVVKNIDFLLYNEAFIAYGEWPALNSGAGIGSVSGNILLKEMRDEPRGKIPFIGTDGKYNMATNSIYESAVLHKYGLKQNFDMQLIGNIMVYPPDYFAPESVLGETAYLTERTVAIHHCRGSWADKKRKVEKDMTLDGIRKVKK